MKAYRYTTGKPNQLLRVEDAVTANTNADDIKTQTGNNYVYNAIGQLVRDEAEHLTYTYNASGLVTSVAKDCGGVTPCYGSSVAFAYNERGQRVKKTATQTTGVGTQGSITYYVRDVQGSVVAVYTDDYAVPNIFGPEPAENPVYGSGRLGIYYRAANQAHYQLTDHLGNVRAVVARAGGSPQINGATDYYPGGMAMPNRNVVGDYRYNYQGQELDKETGKVAFELRLYDPRINRWLTTDPKGEFASPYLAMGNNWINKIDPDGGKTDDIIYLDSDGNEINRIAWEGEHIYLQESYNTPAINGLQVGSYERVASPVNINFNAGINRDVVSVQSLNTLRDIGLQSRVYDITITSTARNAEAQARAMYNNLVRNYQEQRNTYRAPGQRVIDEYDASVAAGLDRAQTIQAMTNRINALGPGTVSRHAADPDVLNVMDLSQRNIPRARHNDFFTNGNAMDGVRILNENRVFHIEIHQN